MSASSNWRLTQPSDDAIERGIDRILACIDADRLAVRDCFGESDRDTAGAAAGVQDAHSRTQVGKQERGVAFGGAPSVRGGVETAPPGFVAELEFVVSGHADSLPANPVTMPVVPARAKIAS